MTDFVYVDIFETKGVEYLIVLGFLGALVLFWRLLMRTSTSTAAAMSGAGAATSVAERWFRLREGIFYHQGHSWAQLEGHGPFVRVGVDDFAQKLVGEPESIELPAVGTRVEQGKKAWNLVANARSIGMLSPVSGEVVEVNLALLENPDMVNRDPYEDGWLARIKLPSLEPQLKNLLSGDLARMWLENTTQRIREKMMVGELGLAMQDGGEVVGGIARNISPENWEELAEEFLLSNESGKGVH